VAEATGTGLGPAITALETARHLGSLPATDEAVRQGRLSETQLKEITGAAILQPESELSLVEAAGEQPLSVLRLRCKRVRAAGQDPRVSYETIRRGRYFRNWIDDAGAVRFDARLTPDAGARLLASIEAETDRLAAAARRAGVDEPRKALAADALAAFVCGWSDAAGLAPEDTGPSDGNRSAPRGSTSCASTGSGRADAPSAVVHVRVDHAALIRGHVEAGELCEIPGIGPIPVEVARRLAAEAYLHVLVTDGVDVTAIARGGRTIPAALRRALVERDPECVVPGCDTHDHLEIDHLVPFADGGEASMANLARLCHWHHYLKTHHGHRLERGRSVDGSAPAWLWTSPGEPPIVPQRIRMSG
jgi:5-methylcytosine-specific restriction endonuclease McrA